MFKKSKLYKDDRSSFAQNYEKYKMTIDLLKSSKPSQIAYEHFHPSLWALARHLHAEQEEYGLMVLIVNQSFTLEDQFMDVTPLFYPIQGSYNSLSNFFTIFNNISCYFMRHLNQKKIITYTSLYTTLVDDDLRNTLGLLMRLKDTGFDGLTLTLKHYNDVVSMIGDESFEPTCEDPILLSQPALWKNNFMDFYRHSIKLIHALHHDANW